MPCQRKQRNLNGSDILPAQNLSLYYIITMTLTIMAIIRPTAPKHWQKTYANSACNYYAKTKITMLQYCRSHRPALYVRSTDKNLSIKTTRPHQSWVQNINTVCCSQNHYIRLRSETWQWHIKRQWTYFISKHITVQIWHISAARWWHIENNYYGNIR